VSDSPSESPIDLEYIGQALRRLTAEVASLRDDMHVLTSFVQRLDNSHGRMLEEIRAMHRQHTRLTDRVHRLESQP
jgi:ubiquinone biosynthesis protein UbiJ